MRSESPSGQRGDLRFVQDVISESRSDRERRHEVLRRARRSRVRARNLRQDAVYFRDVALAQRWRLWSAGVVAEPPSLIPASWSTPQGRDVEELLDRAATACLDCRDATVEFGATRALAALADVTAGHRLGSGHELHFFISATARLIDRLEPSLAADDPEAILRLSAMRRCREACRAALVALSG